MEQRIVPMLAYEDAAAAIGWLQRAFGFEERVGQRHTDADGVVTHAELVRDGAIVMLATPNADYQGPKRHREGCEAARRWQDNPWVIDGLLVQVDDIDAHHARAVAAGATVIRPLGDVDVTGMRLYTAEDLEGHRWMFAQPAVDEPGATLPE
jgi:uncharacterized glyoxalase superfamily protein PhnB